MRTISHHLMLLASLGVLGCGTAASPPSEPLLPVAPASNTGDRDPSADGETFHVKLETTKGDILLEVVPKWSPRGAERFRELVEIGFYDDVAFFRVIDGFMAQVGINGDPEVHAQWADKTIQDDPVIQSNKRGYVTFAKTGLPNSRSTQFFINFGDNSSLDRQKFSPFARVVEGMDVVDSLHSGYGEGAPQGRGPDQGRVRSEGNRYLKANFPKLDYIKKATIVPQGNAPNANAE